MMKQIIQIVPSLPPAINGLGDYALKLACQLLKDFGIETHFIICDPQWIGLAKIESFYINKINNRSDSELLSILEAGSSATVLLHYVGYGYAKRGCPLWLINGVEKWRDSGNKSRKLVTMFHEMYAYSNKPWHSSFWLSSCQKKLAAKLANASDRCITNRENNANIINKLTKNQAKNVLSIPVFSNIGEASEFQIRPLKERKKRIVIFGNRKTRTLAYQKYLPNLEQTCQLLNIDEIFDIGVPTKLSISEINSISIVKKGVISSEEIQEILFDSLAGFLCSPPLDRLAKSGIFAAYCAHRIIPILPKNINQLVVRDGLEAGKNYLVACDRSHKSDNSSLEENFQIAENAYTWYQGHNLSTQTNIFASQLHTK